MTGGLDHQQGDPVLRRAGVAAALATAVLAVWLTLDLPGTGESQLISNLSQLAAATLAGVACVAASRRAEVAQARRGWRVLGASCFAWAAGQAVWTWTESIQRLQPFPSGGDIGFTAATVGFLIGLLTLARQTDLKRWHIRTLVDGLTVAGSLFLISWMVLLQPIIESSTSDSFATAITFFYPFADVAILTMLVLLVARGSVLPRRTILLLGSGFVVLALADSWFAYTELKDLEVAAASNVAWFAGFLLVALGGLSGVRRPEAPAEAPREQSLAMLLAPFVPIAIALGVAVATGAASADAAEPVRFWLAMALFSLLLIRQVLVLLDNRALTESLQDALEDASHAALHDPLTGLANRSLLYELLTREVERSRRSGEQFALAFLDLDGFKAVNDDLGHHIGDEVLRDVADRLRAAVRDADTVARLGGDEFVALLAPVMSRSEANRVAARMAESLDQPIEAGTHRLTVRASLGIALGDGSQSSEDLLRTADREMYRDKAHHRASGGDASGVSPSPSPSDVTPTHR